MNCSYILRNSVRFEYLLNVFWLCFYHYCEKKNHLLYQHLLHLWMWFFDLDRAATATPTNLTRVLEDGGPLQTNHAMFEVYQNHGLQKLKLNVKMKKSIFKNVLIVLIECGKSYQNIFYWVKKKRLDLSLFERYDSIEAIQRVIKS